MQRSRVFLCLLSVNMPYFVIINRNHSISGALRIANQKRDFHHITSRNKKVGWISIAVGIFIALYSALATAVDSYDMDLEKYKTSVYSLYWLYEYCFLFGAFLVICGLLLTIPLIIQEKRANRST